MDGENRMITREELDNKIDIILKKHSRSVYEDAEVCETINAYLCDDLCDVDFNDAKLRRHIVERRM